jgi:hypothetical protein
MAHYALIDNTGFVVNVIVGRNEDEIVDGISDWEKFYEEETGLKCKRTSYNNNIRKNYAGIGYYYDEDRDAFIPPAPFTSWTLNEETCRWEPPTPMPESSDILYYWDDVESSWKILDLKDQE